MNKNSIDIIEMVVGITLFGVLMALGYIVL